eukprot:6205927-Pleurochrysis_carterae.AAC.2
MQTPKNQKKVRRWAAAVLSTLNHQQPGHHQLVAGGMGSKPARGGDHSHGEGGGGEVSHTLGRLEQLALDLHSQEDRSAGHLRTRRTYIYHKDT